MTVPLRGEKKGRNDMVICECTEVRLKALYPQKSVRERDLDTQFTLLRKIYATFCHENFQGKSFSESLRITDALYLRKGSRRSEGISKLLA